MRLFLAIEIPDELRQRVAMWQDSLRATTPSGASWTKPQNLHLTLKFIGEVDAGRVIPIRAALPTVKAAPIALVIDRVIQLPPRGAARVIGAHVSGEVADLFALTQTSLEGLGIPREQRAYRPHITLARFRRSMRVMLEGIALPGASPLRFEARDFVLMRSQLSAEGSRYEVLERFALKSLS